MPHTIGNDAAQWRGEEADEAAGRRHPSKFFVGRGDFIDQPTSNEHLDVHGGKIAAEGEKKPTIVLDFKCGEGAAPAASLHGWC